MKIVFLSLVFATIFCNVLLHSMDVGNKISQSCISFFNDLNRSFKLDNQKIHTQLTVFKKQFFSCKKCFDSKKGDSFLREISPLMGNNLCHVAASIIGNIYVNNEEDDLNYKSFFAAVALLSACRQVVYIKKDCALGCNEKAAFGSDMHVCKEEQDACQNFLKEMNILSNSKKTLFVAFLRKYVAGFLIEYLKQKSLLEDDIFFDKIVYSSIDIPSIPFYQSCYVLKDFFKDIPVVLSLHHVVHHNHGAFEISQVTEVLFDEKKDFQKGYVEVSGVTVDVCDANIQKQNFDKLLEKTDVFYTCNKDLKKAFFYIILAAAADHKQLLVTTSSNDLEAYYRHIKLYEEYKKSFDFAQEHSI